MLLGLSSCGRTTFIPDLKRDLGREAQVLAMVNFVFRVEGLRFRVKCLGFRVQGEGSQKTLSINSSTFLVAPPFCKSIALREAHI